MVLLKPYSPVTDGFNDIKHKGVYYVLQ